MLLLAPLKHFLPDYKPPSLLLAAAVPSPPGHFPPLLKGPPLDYCLSLPTTPILMLGDFKHLHNPSNTWALYLLTTKDFAFCPISATHSFLVIHKPEGQFTRR